MKTPSPAAARKIAAETLASNAPSRVAYEAAVAARSALDAASLKFNRIIVAARRAEFRDACGCERCRGRGKVVTFFTLDGPGFTEYGVCPDCNGKPGPIDRSVCLDVDYGSGRSFSRYNDGPESEIAESFDLDISAARDAERLAEEKARVSKGKKVVVVSGRKIEIGTIAECFWSGLVAAYHNPNVSVFRVGLRLADGTKVYTDGKNVEVAE